MQTIESKELFLQNQSREDSGCISKNKLEIKTAALITLVLCTLTWNINQLEFVLDYLMVLLPLNMLLFGSSIRSHIKLTTLMGMGFVCILTATVNFTVAFIVSCLLSGFFNLKNVDISNYRKLIKGSTLSALTGLVLIGMANFSLLLFQSHDQLQFIVAIIVLTPISLLSRFNWSRIVTKRQNHQILDASKLNLPYRDLYHRYSLITERLLEQKDRFSSEFNELIFLIYSTEKLILHGNKIFDLRLPLRMQQLKKKYDQLQTDSFETDVSRSRVNHLTEIEVQIKYVEDTISFENKLFDQIETNLLIFERVDLSLLRSESLRVSLSSLELTRTSRDIQQSLDAVQDNAEGLIDLSY
tara:strand:+ start:690 stop:1757 length:1068 start_codon:yes stop_codon:yes gene_type:complete